MCGTTTRPVESDPLRISNESPYDWIIGYCVSDSLNCSQHLWELQERNLSFFNRQYTGSFYKVSTKQHTGSIVSKNLTVWEHPSDLRIIAALKKRYKYLYISGVLWTMTNVAPQGWRWQGNDRYLDCKSMKILLDAASYVYKRIASENMIL